MFQLYKYGVETAPAAATTTRDGSVLLVGSAKWKRYRIMLMKINSNGEKEWEKFYGGDKDWEGHFVTKIKDGYLISGAVEGIATPQGGQNWKGYLMKINEDGKKIWERKYRILGNEGIYSVLPLEDGFLLFGITQNKKSFPFLLKTDEEGNKLWHKLYDEGDVIAGITYSKEGFLLAWSNWRSERTFITIVDKEGNILKNRIIEGVVFLNMFNFSGEIFVTGEMGEEVYLSKLSMSGKLIWERTYGQGTGIAMVKTGDSYLLGGDKGEEPFLYIIGSDGKLNSEITGSLWEKGWIELISKIGKKYLIAGQAIYHGSTYMGALIL